MSPSFNRCVFLLLVSLLLLKLAHASPAPQQKPRPGYKYPTTKDTPTPKKQRLPPGRTARLFLYPPNKKSGTPVACLRADGKAIVPTRLGGLSDCDVFVFKPTGLYKDYRPGVLTPLNGGSCAIAEKELLCRPGKLSTGSAEFFSLPYALNWGYIDNFGESNIIDYWNAEEPLSKGKAVKLYAIPRDAWDPTRKLQYRLVWS